MFSFNKEPGLSHETAIEVQNVGEQYEYIDTHFSDYSMRFQSLKEIDGVVYDVLTLHDVFTKKEIQVYFKTQNLFKN
ncbi:MAG: hypothetical protein RL217_503 [Pseudomonadota bacterium]|jgi:hypothetical protein